MMAFLIPGLILFASIGDENPRLISIADEFPRSFDKLEEAGYTKEISSLLEALNDHRSSLCGDATYFLRKMGDDAHCPELSMAIAHATERLSIVCTHQLLKFHFERCEKDSALYDLVYKYASLAYQGSYGIHSSGLAFHTLVHLHENANFDIFDFAMQEAKEAISWLSRDFAFRVLLDSYCDRLTQDDVDQIWATYPDEEGIFLRMIKLKSIRKRIEHATFPCEKEEVTEEEATADKD